jgi:hypothetical protein
MILDQHGKPILPKKGLWGSGMGEVYGGSIVSKHFADQIEANFRASRILDSMLHRIWLPASQEKYRPKGDVVTIKMRKPKEFECKTEEMGITDQELSL